ncbi:MAG: hypothetical protein ACKOWE_00090 [Micrococcales bacterium]
MNNRQARAQLAYSYTLPIAGAALGTVTGLMLNDVLPDRYESWTWVIVQLLLGVSLVLGNRFAANARNFEVKTKKHLNAFGARAMNFVLSIIWSSVMAIMASAFIAAAVENLKLRTWIEKPADPMGGYEDIKLVPFTGELFVRDFLPAILLLAIFVVGTLLWLVNRAKESE